MDKGLPTGHGRAGGSGGGGGIRTRERLSPLPVFKTGAFNHSATPPQERSTNPSPLSRCPEGAQTPIGKERSVTLQSLNTPDRLVFKTAALNRSATLPAELYL